MEDTETGSVDSSIFVDEDEESIEEFNGVDETEDDEQGGNEERGGDWETRYKNLQSKFNERDEEIRSARNLQDSLEHELSAYGGIEGVKQWANYLNSNPRFSKWIESELNQSKYGTGDIDPNNEEQKRAVEIVRNIVRGELDGFERSKIAPLTEAQKQGELVSNLQLLAQKYGDFSKHREAMAELSEQLPKSQQDNPSLDVLEGLLIKAMVSKGELMTPDQYQKKFINKTRKSTSTSGSSGGAPSESFGSLQSALEAALKG